MSVRWIRLVRRSMTVLWVGLLVSLLLLVVASHLTPMTGHTLFIVRGASMSPAIPLGSVAVDEHVDPASVHIGDVVTLDAGAGHVITHRVTAVFGSGDDLRFQVRGDANATPDPVLDPASTVAGRVTLVVPYLGYLLAMLTLPIGWITVLSWIGTLLLATWLLEEIEDEMLIGRRALDPVGGRQGVTA